MSLTLAARGAAGTPFDVCMRSGVCYALGGLRVV